MNKIGDINKAWEKLATSYDPIEHNEEAWSQLRNRVKESDGISNAIAHMQLVSQEEGDSLAAMGYEFCLDPILWRTGMEAVLQARAMQQILSWVKVLPIHAKLLQLVVVRQTFDQGFDFVAPMLVPHQESNFKFLVIPIAYQELLHFPATALSELFPAQDSGGEWDFLINTESPDISRAQPPRAFRRLVARILTSAASDPNIEGPNPVDVLSLSDGWFQGVSIDKEPGNIEKVFGYSGQDFALAHEIGHCLAPVMSANKSYIQGEVDADFAGYRLFALSWGWRDQVIKACPLGENAKTVLGPIWFFFTASLLFTIRQGLRKRLLEATGSNENFLGVIRDEEHVRFLATRWIKVCKQVDIFIDIVKMFGGNITSEDEERLIRFANLLDRFTNIASDWLINIPNECLVKAIKLI